MIKNHRGVTTVQWLVFAGVFGFVALLAMWGVSVSRGNARDAIRVANVKEIQAGLELFYNDHNTYPSSPQDGVILGSLNARCLDAEGFHSVCSEKTYLLNIPTAPEPADKKCDPVINAYRYSSDGTQYVITFCTGRVIGNLEAGTHRASTGKIE